MPDFEITEKTILHVNIDNNDYEQDSKVLYTFVPSRSFGIKSIPSKLLEISLTNLKTLNIFNSKLLYILWTKF